MINASLEMLPEEKGSIQYVLRPKRRRSPIRYCTLQIGLQVEGVVVHNRTKSHPPRTVGAALGQAVQVRTPECAARLTAALSDGLIR